MVVVALCLCIILIFEYIQAVSKWECVYISNIEVVMLAMACYEKFPHLIHTRTIASAFTIASATKPALAPRTRSVPPIVQV